MPSMKYTMMRATDMDSLRLLEARMAGCFQSGAVTTGCEHGVRETAPPCDAPAPDRFLAEVFRAEMICNGQHPLPVELEARFAAGDTDMGNVTQVLPGIHPVVGIDAGGASLHQPEFAAAAAGPSADKAVIDGSIMRWPAPSSRWRRNDAERIGY